MTSPLLSPRQRPTAPRGRRWLPPVGLALAALALAAAACRSEPHLIPLAAAKGEHDIEGGEVDRFAITLGAGDFLHAVVEERGVDLKVTLLHPDGAELSHVDGFWGRNDPEELAAIARGSGVHVLEIRAGEGKPPGAYRLTYDPSRPATAADRLRAEAVSRTQEACDASSIEPPEESLARQLELRRASLGLWRRLGDRAREAEAHFQIGIVLHHQKAWEAAIGAYLRAEEIWRQDGDLPRQAEALRQAGRAYRDAGHLEQARDAIERARVIAHTAGDSETEMAALNGLGRLEVAAGDASAALAPFKAALELAAKHGFPGQEVSILNNLAGAYEALGEPQRALECYHKARKIAAGDDFATTLNNAGLFYQSLGDSDQAVEHFRQALELELPKERRARTLNNLGLALRWRDRPREALDPLVQALQLGEQLGEKEVQVRAAVNLALTYIDLKDPGRAREMAQRALAAAEGRQDLLIDAHAMLAEAYRAEGDLAAARAELDRTLALVRQRRHVSWEDNVETELLLARLERATGKEELALKRVRRAISTVESVRSRVVDLELRATLLASRQPLYELEIDLLMDLGGAARQAEALQASERAHARSLLDMLNQAGADVRKGAATELVESQRRLLQQVSLLENHRRDLEASGASASEIAEAERQVRVALADYDAAEDEMLRSSSRYRSLAQPKLLGLVEIQRELLDGDSLLLEYSLGEERSYLWAVTTDAFHAFELPPRAKIAGAAKGFYDLLTARNKEGPAGETKEAKRARIDLADRKYPGEAARLGELVVGPAAGLLAGKRLLVVPDGALHYVPFQALVVGAAPGGPGKALVEEHEVVILPSASAMAALRDEDQDRRRPQGILAVLADPVFERDDDRFSPGGRLCSEAASKSRGQLGIGRGPRQEELTLERLYFSCDEATAIASLVEEERKLVALDFDASRDRALGGELARYRFVHFATHGLIDTRRPDLSQLVLSQFDRSGKRQNGQLLLADIYDLDLNADLVVLSACETALGREIRGEGLVGLTRGFMHAGAPRVVASLWSVDDRATAGLMESFYRGMLQRALPPAAALHEAQLEVRARSRWAHPYYWAGFSLQGEWR